MSGTEELIARLWEQFRPLAERRIGLIEAYVGGREVVLLSEVPTPWGGDARTQARQAAHDLVGALGSYGRPDGSRLARDVEHLLLGDAAADEVPGRDELSRLLAALRSEVTR
ncbi:Hpt domain-containing protein [Actinotalea sp. AC32]|nr:Hpt domain-containing protein [Actinotalea sp. AC32]